MMNRPLLLFAFLIIALTGCDDDKNQQKMPSADFEASETEIYIWEKVRFRPAEPDEQALWQWFFEGGDPDYSEEPEPEVLYKLPGQYDVKLIVVNHYGENTHELEGFIQVREYPVPTAIITDLRDNQTYKITTIAGQQIMAENLNYLAGDAVYYNDDPENGKIHGMLYTWETALEACPDGWRLPTRAEYEIIRGHLGGEYIAGGKLKSPGFQHWDPPNSYASNSTGFTALGSGYFMGGPIGFWGIGETAVFWTQTTSSHESHIWSVALSHNNARMAIQNTTTRNNLLSVRCIRD